MTRELGTCDKQLLGLGSHYGTVGNIATNWCVDKAAHGSIVVKRHFRNFVFRIDCNLCVTII